MSSVRNFCLWVACSAGIFWVGETLFLFEIVVATIFDLWQCKIGESRNSIPCGKCEGERRKGGGEGEKKYACPISLFFWETRYAGKRSSWLVRHREVDWCLSINCKSILFIPFRSVFSNWSGWECRVYYAMRKSKRFLHWSSGQDLLAVLKPTPLLPHAKMVLVSIRFFFSSE